MLQRTAGSGFPVLLDCLNVPTSTVSASIVVAAVERTSPALHPGWKSEERGDLSRGGELVEEMEEGGGEESSGH